MDGQDISAVPQDAEPAAAPKEISYEDALAKPQPATQPSPPQVPLAGTAAPQKQISYEDAAFAGRPDSQKSVLGQMLGTDAIDKFASGFNTLGYNILNAYGDLAHQTADDWKQELTESNGGDFVESLRKTGMFDAHAQDQSDFHNAYLLKQAVPATENLVTGLLGTFNEDVARGTAAIGTGAQAIMGGLSIPFSEAGKAAGLSDEEQVGFMALLHIASVPSVPRPIAEAHAKGIIGTSEGQNSGIEPLTEAQHVTQTVAEAQVNPPQAAPPPDIHAMARNLAPETFSAYDPLLAKQETLRAQLADLGSSRTADLDAQIQAIQDAKEGGYGKLQSLIEKRDNIIAQGDTPEMEAVRQQIQENDYKMRDLAPQVSEAYRQASEFAPQEPVPQVVPETETPEEGKARRASYTSRNNYVIDNWLGRENEEDKTPVRVVRNTEQHPHGVGSGYIEYEGQMIDASNLIKAGKTDEEIIATMLGDHANGEAPDTSKVHKIDEAAPEAGQSTAKPIEEQKQTIISDLTPKLVAAGRPQEEANVAAQLEASFFQTLSEQYPKFSAEEWYNREGSDVKGPRKTAPVLGHEELGQSVYHGSPYKFDKFTLDHIGSGEGAQAYGHGLYFASEPKVAEYYRQQLAGSSNDPEVLEKYFKPGNIVKGYGGYDKVISFNKNDGWNWTVTVREVDKNGEVLKGIDGRERTHSTSPDAKDLEKAGLPVGQLYKAEVPDDHELLLWDKPVSEQSDAIKNALPKIADTIGKSNAAVAQTKVFQDVADGKREGALVYRMLSKALGGDKEASEYLNSLGIKGIKYLDRNSRGLTGVVADDKATHNFVIFDDKAINDVNALYQSNRGKIRLATDDARAQTSLLKNANASTWFHESGHRYTDILFRLAKEDDAPQQMKADAATLKKWLNLPEDADMRETSNGKFVYEKGLEKLARGFERWLMEGTAPSRALASIFAKLKQWMTAVYKTADALKAPISDDVRDVYARMFASNPEKTVIAPEHEPGSLLASIHERDAAETPVEKAPEVADNIRSEVDQTAKTHNPEVADALKSAETKADASEVNGSQPVSAETTGQPVVETPQPVNAGGNATETKGAYERIPRKPVSLIDWLKKQGGVKDENGEVATIMGGKKGGLIRKNGQSLDDLARAAQEAGYFDAGERPDINGLLDKIREDQAGNKQYSIHDAQAVEAYNSAIARNAETDRIVDQFGIDAKGKTSAQIYDEIADRMSQEQQAKEIESLTDAQKQEMSEAEKAAKEWLKSRGESWEPDAFYGHSTTATLEDLENAREQERLAAQQGQGAGGASAPGTAAGDKGQIQGGGGQDGRGAEPTGRTGTAEGTADSAAGGAEAGAGSGLARSDVAANAARGTQPSSSRPDPKTPNEDFGQRKSGFIDKAGNLRPELITSDQDVRDALHEYADNHPELVTHEVVTDQQVADMADAMGVDARELNIQHLRDLSVNDGIPLAVRVRGGMKMLVDNLNGVIELMNKEPTDENAIKYLDAKERALVMMETMSGVSNEMGRAFRAFNNFYKEYGMKNVDEIKELFQRTTNRTIDDVKAEMQKGKKLNTPQQMGRYLQKSYEPDFLDRIIEYRNDCLLSGPITHAFYTTGNYSTAFLRPFGTLFGVASQALEEVGGKEINERVYAREALAQWNALTYGSWRGLQAAAKSWRENAEVAVPGEIAARGAKAIAAQNAPVIPGLGQELTWMTRQSALATGGIISRTAGKLMSPVGRSISALHSLQKVVFYEQGKAALAVREALDKGLEPGSDDYTKFVTDRINNPTTDIMNKAGKEAIKFAGREKTDYNSLGGKAMNMINTYRPLKLVFPFMKMDYNFEMMAYRDNSLLGLLSQKTRADLAGANGDVARNMAKGRMALGTSLLGSGVGLAALGINNGSGPSDPKAWKTWRLTHTPYSLQIGSITIPHKALGPIFGKFLGMSANIVEGIHQFSTDDVTKSSVQFIDKIGDAMFQSTLVKQVGDAAEAAFTGGQKATRFIQNFATSFLPYDVGAGQVNRAFVDPYSRRIKSFGPENAFGIPEAMMYQYPGASGLLEPNYDMFGRPISTSSSYDQYANDPVVQKLESLQTGIGRLSDKIKGIQLTEEQYSEFSRLAGQMTYARLSKMVAQPSFDKLPPQHQLVMIEKAVTLSRNMAASTVMKEYPQIKKDAIAKKRTAMFGNPAVNNVEDDKYEDNTNP